MSNYATTAEAQAYFDTRLHTDDWDGASDADKTKALTMATRIIERLNFLGYKTDSDQELQFPRNDDTTIPTNIQYACAEIAMKLLGDFDMELEYENLRLLDMNLANVRTSYDPDMIPEHIVAGVPSREAWLFLRPFIRDDLNVKLFRID